MVPSNNQGEENFAQHLQSLMALSDPAIIARPSTTSVSRRDGFGASMVEAKASGV